MIAFDEHVLGPDPERRRTLLEIARRALAAVDPERSVRREVRRANSRLLVGGRRIDLTPYRRAVVLGFGKAAVGMGRALLPVLEGLEVTGILVTNRAESVPPLEVREASHPVPDERSVAAGERIMARTREAGPDDLMFVLISGGGSALIEVPAPGLDLEMLRSVNSLLLRSGADIAEVNAVRKHLSAIKGGRLAEAAAGAALLVTLIISDVVGNSLEAIASGPTVADSTTYADALAVLDRYELRSAVPDAVLGHLRAGAQGSVPETPCASEGFAGQIIRVIADAGRAAEAAARTAVKMGYRARVATTELRGEAKEVARKIVRDAARLAPGDVLVYAGETTVTVTGPGVGGRNQELALAASIELEGRDDMIVLSLGTDGTDGMTTAAGAFADGSAVPRGSHMGLDAGDHLERNDSHTFLAAIGDGVVCGSTGTNVGDLILVWGAPPDPHEPR